MSITRTKLSFERDFTQIPNEWVRDTRLSRKARGLLAEILSHSIGWQVTVEGLIKAGTEGRVAIRAAIKELEGCGYLKRVVTRSEDGTALAGSHYELGNPHPIDQSGRFPDSHETRQSENVTVTEPVHKEDQVLKEDQDTPEDQDAPATPPLDPIIEALTEELAELIMANGFPKPKGKTAYDDCRKLIYVDKRDPEKARNLMKWATADPFWRANIRSMAKFRGHYNSLRLAALADWEKNKGTGSGPSGEIDPDAVLGKDYWQPPSPPEGLSIQEELAWKRQAAETHKAERMEAARKKVAGRG